MEILTCEQGSEEWIQARLGIPTASNFDQIITTEGRPSKSAATYMNKLLAERMTRKPLDDWTNRWLERGKELEGSAKDLYALQRDEVVQDIGFAYLDARKDRGASPDGLLGNKGGLELKCPAPWTHVAYMRSRKVPTEYMVQIQGSMYVTGRQWWDFMSYHPDMPPVILRVVRDQGFIDALDRILNEFIADLEKQWDLLQ